MIIWIDDTMSAGNVASTLREMLGRRKKIEKMKTPNGTSQFFKASFLFFYILKNRDILKCGTISIHYSDNDLKAFLFFFLAHIGKQQHFSFSLSLASFMSQEKSYWDSSS